MTERESDSVRALASSGPAFEDVARLGPINWQAWRATARRLAHDLDGAADVDRRVHHLYMPVLFFCAARARAAAARPLVIGIQAPQGAGKTTLVAHLLARLPDLGLQATGVSIDDFYLTRDAQVRLAEAHPGNPYLEHRGYPGTHDIDLGVETLTALASLDDAAGARSIRVPVYDKSLHGGRGDRASVGKWRTVTGPLDIVFVEGWMLGFTPVAKSRLQDPHLVEPNAALEAYDRWHRVLGGFVSLRATDPSFVLRWRVEAEAAMIARGLPGLDRAAIEDYVRRFLPAYALYTGGSGGVAEDAQLTIYLDELRRAIASPSFSTSLQSL